MKKHNATNERIKRKYFTFLKEAKRQSEPTVDATAKALKRFEVYTNFKDFKAFHHQQAIGFKKYLTKEKNKQTGKELSQATLHATFTQLKGFFQWLSREQGYKSRVQYSDADYFHLSNKSTRIATSKRQQRVPTVMQIQHTIKTMPAKTEIEQRNKALIAFTLLTGARDNAIASMKLKHIDLTNKHVFQDAREVKTKFSKTINTFFFPVGREIVTLVEEWVSYLRDEKLYGNDDPIFPKTQVSVGSSHQFEATGLTKEHWKTTTPIRKIFQEAFTGAGLEYFNPHSFRKTIAQLGEKLCKNPEEFKAWSQNLGHEQVLTTFTSYGEVAYQRQGEIIHDLATPQEQQPDTTEIEDKVLQKLLHRLGNSNTASSHLKC
jgi:integrase